VAAPAVAVPGREDGAASPPALPGGVQRCAPLPLDLFGGQDVEDAPLELGHAAAAPAPHPGPEQAAAPLEPAPPHTEEQPSVHSEAAALPAQAHSAVVGSEAAQVAGAAGAAVVSNAARTAWEEDADDGFATEGAARATSAGQQALQAGGAWGEVAGSELPALAAGRPGSGLAVQEAAAALHAGGAPPMPTPASAGAAPADGAAEDAASLSHGGDAPSSEAADPLHTAHPAGSQGGSSAPAASSSAWQQLGGGLLPRVPTPSSGAGLALAATPGEEAVTEYGLAWARLLQAAAHLLQASAAVWGEATTSGAWRRQLEQGEGQAHLAACAWLYCAAATVRWARQAGSAAPAALPPQFLAGPSLQALHGPRSPLATRMPSPAGWRRSSSACLGWCRSCRRPGARRRLRGSACLPSLPAPTTAVRRRWLRRMRGKKRRPALTSRLSRPSERRACRRHGHGLQRGRAPRPASATRRLCCSCWRARRSGCRDWTRTTSRGCWSGQGGCVG
jgi:hypothetical protein